MTSIPRRKLLTVQSPLGARVGLARRSSNWTNFSRESQVMATRKPSPNAQFSALVSRFPPEIVALVKRCMPKIRRAIPCSYQLVYEYSNSLVVAFGMSELGYEAIVAIAIFPRWIRLYFDKSLPDPKGLLEGSGTKVRSVT